MHEFIEDVKKESPSYKARMEGRTFSTILGDQTALPESTLDRKTTPEKIKLIMKRSKENEAVHQKLKCWKDVMTEKGPTSALLALLSPLFCQKERR